ncbi:MAG: hypothetical protein R3F62_27540 [Planctomycetota bacterium]
MGRIVLILGVALLAGCSSTPEPPPFNPKSTVDQNLTKSVLAPRQFKLAPGLQVGGKVARRTTVPGLEEPIETWYAVVGEEDGHWRVECVSDSLQSLHATNAETRALVIGCAVNKETGVVSRAVVGKPGELAIEISVEEPLDADPEPVEREATVEVPGLGEVPALERELAEYEETSWYGTEGALAGVLLKFQGPEAYALSAAPAETSFEVSGHAIEALALTYDNGAVVKLAKDDPLLATFYPAPGPGRRGLIGEVQPYFKSELTAYATDATPQLVWDAPEGANPEGETPPRD